MAGKVYIRTFGCQMNEYDSAKLADVLAAREGYEPAAAPEDADLIVFNTCSVREKAQEKVFADLGRVKQLKRAKPGMMIAFAGALIRFTLKFLSVWLLPPPARTLTSSGIGVST